MRRTEAHFGGRSEGWGFGNGRKPAAKRRPRKRKLPGVLESAIAYQLPVLRAPSRPAKPRSGAKRTPPKGGLDLKAIGAAWTAAGKAPGTGMTWAQFRAANSHLRLK